MKESISVYSVTHSIVIILIGVFLISVLSVTDWSCVSVAQAQTGTQERYYKEHIDMLREQNYKLERIARSLESIERKMKE
jgi:hypothetical protein